MSALSIVRFVVLAACTMLAPQACGGEVSADPSNGSGGSPGVDAGGDAPEVDATAEATTGSSDGSGREAEGDGAGAAGNAGAAGSSGDAGGVTCHDGVESNLAFGTEGTSCSGGLTCGAVSCCQTILLPGGSFGMGRSTDGCDAHDCWTDPCSECGQGDYCPDDERPEHAALMGPFYLDTFEVTVGRFRRFVEQYDGTPPPEGAAAHPLVAGSGWQAAWDSQLPSSQTELVDHLKSCENAMWTDTPGSYEAYEINCVNWYEAFAFCAWDGGRLPTEAEWEYAAAGGEQNRLYPWGQEKVDNHDPKIWDWPGPVDSHVSRRGRWGHYGLAGNVFEWTFDAYSPSWYDEVGNVCDNCANTADGTDRVMRGGCWDYNTSLPPSFHWRAVTRTQVSAGAADYLFGFRCARNL